jgi:polyferredoxin
MYRAWLMKKKLTPVKRKIIQLISFVLCNPHIKNFADGKLYTGKWKHFCSPGLNCYSCPAAALSCPIGAMQAVSGSMDFKFSFYVTGILLALGTLFGRAVCAFLCPFGLLQELLHKIPSPKIKLPAWTKYIKYAVLLIFVLLLPVASTNYAGLGEPAFCKYICPAGTLEGGIPNLLLHEELQSLTGSLFILKLSILIITLLACIFIMRFFCKVLCPLGAIYGLCNKFSLFTL